MVDFYPILYGTNNDFNSISCDTNSSLSTGKLYISTADKFFIVNLATHNIVDFYSPTVSGATNESLISNDIVDINIAGQ